MKVRITEYLELDLGTEQWCCQRCGCELIGARENYKKGCLVAERPLEEVHPPMTDGQTYSFCPDPDFCRILEFYCPTCGTLIENEYLPPGHPITHDIELDLDGLKRGTGCDVETGRQLFDSFMAGRVTARPPYVPLFSQLVARVGGLEPSSLTSDSTSWAGALMKTADLFDLDGVVVGFDWSLMAEACGCSVTWQGGVPRVSALAGPPGETPRTTGRMQQALETAQRIFPVVRARRGCVATLTGPLTLARQLFGRGEGDRRLAETKQSLVQVVEGFCEQRPDMLWVMEQGPLAVGDQLSACRRAYNTITNVAGYYDVPVFQYLHGYEAADLAAVSQLKTDGLVLGPQWERGLLPPTGEVVELGSGGRCLGAALPIEDIDAARRLGREWLEQCRSAECRLLFTSLDSETGTGDLEPVHQLAREIREMRL